MNERSETLLKDFFVRYPTLVHLRVGIEQTIASFVQIKKENKKILICGNGGSAADSEHISGELLKSFCLKREIRPTLKEQLSAFENGSEIAENLQEGIKCIPLHGFSAFNTAYANDCNGDFFFAQLVNVLGDSGDILFCISTSGNSKNIMHAAKVAKVKGLKIISLTGESGGKLKGISDVLLNAPAQKTFVIQEYHLPMYHIICLCAESELWQI